MLQIRSFFYNKTVPIIAFVLCCLSLNILRAQDSCTFKLRVFDKFGIGWNGSQVYIKLGNKAEVAYTHDGLLGLASDSVHIFNIRVRVGDSLFVRYDDAGAGSQDEIKYSLINNAGDVLFSDGPIPKQGKVFSGLTKCISCGLPINPVVVSVRALTTTISWQPALVGAKLSYRVEWDSVPFTLGLSKNVYITQDTFFILQGLKELTNYKVFVKTLCGSDTSTWSAPLIFRTDTANNVGVSKIFAPINRCDLNIDSVKIMLKNYGGAPQILIPIKYSVNGTPVSINYPIDGNFTGNLSKDSIVPFTFKATYDFSQPGEYMLAAWTELPGDLNKANDTFKLSVTRPRVVTKYPDAQNFEGGKDTWAVVDSAANSKSTWAWATPNYKFITNAASGKKCWTNCVDTSYRDRDTSYILSPCYDFSGLTTDPRLNFAISFYTEPHFDGTWLEASTDGGKTWSRVSRNAKSINWYNDTISRTTNEFWAGTNRLGWRNAQTILTGFAGKPSCRFRFIFQSDATTVPAASEYSGVAIDNFLISAPAAIDFAADSVGLDYMNTCRVSIRVTNLGTSATGKFSLGYKLENGASVIEQLDTTPIAVGGSFVYTFKSQLTTPTVDNQKLLAWVSLSGDNFSLNDTLPFKMGISKPISVNTVYNFDDLKVPTNWIGKRAGIRAGGANGHGNAASNGFIYADIYKDTNPAIAQFSNILDFTAGKFGPVRADDSLFYTYRFVNDNAPYAAYALQANDGLRVDVATECDTIFTSLDTVSFKNQVVNANYNVRKLSLAKFTGKIIKIRFNITSPIQTYSGYFADIDSINYHSVCPSTFGFAPAIKNADPNRANGTIKIKPTLGTGPYTFNWSNGATTDSVSTLASGTYTVTVTDANKCTDIRNITVQTFVGVNDPASIIDAITIAPNPTNSNSTLDIKLKQASAIRVTVFNMVGQLVQSQFAQNVTERTFDIDLSNVNNGMYLIRVDVDNATQVIRLVKQE